MEEARAKERYARQREELTPTKEQREDRGKTPAGDNGEAQNDPQIIPAFSSGYHRQKSAAKVSALLAGSSLNDENGGSYEANQGDQNGPFVSKGNRASKARASENDGRGVSGMVDNNSGRIHGRNKGGTKGKEC